MCAAIFNRLGENNGFKIKSNAQWLAFVGLGGRFGDFG
jgi:hypothetical protein